MLRDTVSGFEDVFDSNLTAPANILIAGPPGSMKSTLVFTILSKHATLTNSYGLYMTLEQEKNSLLMHMRAIGIPITNRLQIYDYSISRELLTDTAKTIDFLELIERLIYTQKEKMGSDFNCFGLDSLGALYTLSKNIPDLRIRMYHFFRMLRENNITSFIIMEIPRFGSVPIGAGQESFLVDGMIEMGFIELKHTTKLYMQVIKMRGLKHSRDKFSVHVEKGSLIITKEVFD